MTDERLPSQPLRSFDGLSVSGTTPELTALVGPLTLPVGSAAHQVGHRHGLAAA